MARTPMLHFLLVFDHEHGRLLDEIEFGEDSDRAVAAYAEKEREYKDRGLIEIVLIGSDSLETVKFTHANYFDGSVAVSKYLEGLVAGEFFTGTAAFRSGKSTEILTTGR